MANLPTVSTIPSIRTVKRSSSPARPVRLRGMLMRVGIWLVVLDVLVAALFAGVRLRRWMWVQTDAPHPSLRFNANITNAYRWGSAVLSHAQAKAASAGNGAKATDWRYFLPAYFELYREVMREHPDGQYDLDYTPARLLADALWVRHERLIYPHIREWQRSYTFTAPLLWFNTICELLAALGAFLLVRHWVWRATLPPDENPARKKQAKRPEEVRLPWDPSPTVVYPAEEPTRFPVPARAWILGLIAALLIWFNPAILFDAHVYPQWEVWLLPSFFFAAWLASRGNWLLAGLVIPIGLLLKGQLSMVLPVFILWPLLARQWKDALWLVIGFIVAAIVLLSPWLIHLDFGWWKIGFIYPINHWQRMGGNTDNVPAILESFGWSLSDPVFRLPHWLHFKGTVSIKQLLVSIYVVCLPLTAWGMSRKDRRNDPAFLIALSTPWLLMFTLLGQMNDRYYLWAAAATATTIAIGLGWGLLHVLVSAIATSMIVRTMLTWGKSSPDYPRLAHVLDGLHPGISWAVVLITAIFLYCALAPRRSKETPRLGDPQLR